MTDQAQKSAKLTIGERTLDLPIYQGTIGPDVVDIRRLYTEGGVFTYQRTEQRDALETIRRLTAPKGLQRNNREL